MSKINGESGLWRWSCYCSCKLFNIILLLCVLGNGVSRVIASTLMNKTIFVGEDLAISTTSVFDLIKANKGIKEDFSDKTLTFALIPLFSCSTVTPMVHKVEMEFDWDLIEANKKLENPIVLKSALPIPLLDAGLYQPTFMGAFHLDLFGDSKKDLSFGRPIRIRTMEIKIDFSIEKHSLLYMETKLAKNAKEHLQPVMIVKVHRAKKLGEDVVIFDDSDLPAHHLLDEGDGGFWKVNNRYSIKFSKDVLGKYADQLVFIAVYGFEAVKNDKDSKESVEKIVNAFINGSEYIKGAVLLGTSNFAKVPPRPSESRYSPIQTNRLLSLTDEVPVKFPGLIVHKNHNVVLEDRDIIHLQTSLNITSKDIRSTVIRVTAPNQDCGGRFDNWKRPAKGEIRDIFLSVNSKHWNGGEYGCEIEIVKTDGEEELIQLKPPHIKIAGGKVLEPKSQQIYEEENTKKSGVHSAIVDFVFHAPCGNTGLEDESIDISKWESFKVNLSVEDVVYSCEKEPSLFTVCESEEIPVEQATHLCKKKDIFHCKFRISLPSKLCNRPRLCATVTGKKLLNDIKFVDRRSVENVPIGTCRSFCIKTKGANIHAFKARPIRMNNNTCLKSRTIDPSRIGGEIPLDVHGTLFCDPKTIDEARKNSNFEFIVDKKLCGNQSSSLLPKSFVKFASDSRIGGEQRAGPKRTPNNIPTFIQKLELTNPLSTNDLDI